jgi:hypothetical protein
MANSVTIYIIAVCKKTLNRTRHSASIVVGGGDERQKQN